MLMLVIVSNCYFNISNWHVLGTFNPVALI